MRPLQADPTKALATGWIGTCVPFTLWLIAAAIGAAVLIFAHASLAGVLIGVAFLGLSVLLL